MTVITIIDEYVDDGYWVDGYASTQPGSTSVLTPTTVQSIIPSYLYWEYSDDSDLQAFVASYNSIAQQFLNTFNQLNLPVYAGDNLIVGALLDWVALGIYGIPRPVLSATNAAVGGPYNTLAYNQNPYNTLKSGSSGTVFSTTDDIFKRILTWNLYRGDGQIFNIMWLKRRVMRFLTGLNGTDPGIDQTYLVGVTLASGAFTIDVTPWQTANPSSTLPAILQQAINVGCLNLPFTYTYTVTI